MKQVDAELSRARRLLSDHRVRARKNGATLDYGLLEVRQLLASCQLCEYCRRPLDWTVSLDHRQPISRGGKHALVNLAVCCQRCNEIKGMLAEAEFRELLTLLALLHPTARQDIERRLVSGGARYSASRRRGG